MTLFKLSLLNFKKSIKDYTIYFATLILGVAIFYVFNALENQTVMLDVSSSSYDIIDLMNKALSGVSVFVSFILGFLIVYASNFLMKRRKKEFGVYMLLGMKKRKIATIILGETVLIGLMSLAIGLLLGMVASQGMSVVVANMFEADMTKFSFIISKSAIVKTILYFFIMYIVVMLLDTFVVGKARLIDLINASRKAEKNTAKNTYVCVVVFCIAVILLVSSYRNVTVNVEKLSTTSSILMQIGKGVLATFMIFWSLSGLLLFLATKNKNFYMKGLNCFSVRELSSRINTTVFSGSIICLMLFITICVLSGSMSVKKSINDNLGKLVPVDVNFCNEITGANKDSDSIKEAFKEVGVDTSMFKDSIDITSYKFDNLTMADTVGQKVIDDLSYGAYVNYLAQTKEELIKVSDYNKIAKLYGEDEYTLADNEYVIMADYTTIVNVRNAGLENNNVITINGKEYKSKYTECQDEFILMSSNYTNFGFIVVPDNIDLTGAKENYNYYIANYNENYDMNKINSQSKTKYDQLSEYIDSAGFDDKLNPSNKKWASINISSKTFIYSSSIGLSAMIVFIGIYIGIVFMISSAAILALKELSEATDNREKYMMLRRVGVSEKLINRSLLKQCLIFFGLPLILASIHSIFGIQTSVYILETFGTTGLLYSIITTAVMIVSIYGIYFALTYASSKKIISE